jgi:hypothetical protein
MSYAYNLWHFGSVVWRVNPRVGLKMAQSYIGASAIFVIPLNWGYDQIIFLNTNG